MARPSPWKSLAAPDPVREYLFLLSHLPLHKARAVPRFVRYTLRIRAQLETSAGAIGYSLKANLRTRDFWTLSVWDDEQALAEFVRRNPTAT